MLDYYDTSALQAQMIIRKEEKHVFPFVLRQRSFASFDSWEVLEGIYVKALTLSLLIIKLTKTLKISN